MKYNKHSVKAVIVDKLREESLNASTEDSYDEVACHMNSLFYDLDQAERKRLGYALKSGFYQGKYTMRHIMLLQVEDILDQILELLDQEEGEADEVN